MRLYEGPELPESQVVRLSLLSETTTRHELKLTSLSGDSVSPAAAAAIAESRDPVHDFLKHEINQKGSVFVGLPGRYSVGVKYLALLAIPGQAVVRDTRTKKKRAVEFLFGKSKPATLQFQAAAGHSYSLSFDDYGVRKGEWVLDVPLAVTIWVKCRETGQPVTERLRVDVFLTATY
jgi:hypothetical protein